MQTTILFLAALAAICFGAAIPKPQELGGATTGSVRPLATYTLVVPCYGVPGCVPQTLTIAARDEPAFTIPSFDLPAVSRDPVPTLDPREPQVIVTASRTVIIGPTPPASTKTTSTKKTTSSTKKATSWTKKSSSTKKATSSTKKSTTSITKKPTSTNIINSTKGQGSRTVSIGNRQELGTPTRVVWGWPWPTKTPPVSVVTVTVTYFPTTTTEPIPTTRVTSEGAGTTRYATTTLQEQIGKRQALGSPSRTVLEWPTWVWPSPTTSIKTVTVTVTYTPPPVITPSPPSTTTTGRVTVTDDGSSRTVTGPLVVTLDKRQSLGEPSRTDQVVPTTVIVPTTLITSIYITTTRIVTQTVPTTIKSVSTATTSISVTQTTTTCTESDVETPTTSPVVSRSTTTDDGSSRTVTTTLGVPIKGRQELGGGIPSFSVSWNGEGTGVPWATQSFDKRQELGQPSRSFTFDGAAPTASATETRSVTFYREM